jgi:hypothetical protein
MQSPESYQLVQRLETPVQAKRMGDKYTLHTPHVSEV